MESEGQDAAELRTENNDLESRISAYQKELRKKYKFSY